MDLPDHEGRACRDGNRFGPSRPLDRPDAPGLADQLQFEVVARGRVGAQREVDRELPLSLVRVHRHDRRCDLDVARRREDSNADQVDRRPVSGSRIGGKDRKQRERRSTEQVCVHRRLPTRARHRQHEDEKKWTEVTEVGRRAHGTLQSRRERLVSHALKMRRRAAERE